LVAKVRLAELGERQWGVVTRRQLEAAGVAKGEVTRWIAERRLHRIYPGVYSVGHGSLATEGKLAAALLYAGPGAELFGLTAGYWFGFLPTEPKKIHVCTPRRRLSLPDVQVHTEKKRERYWHNGLPTTPPAQALLDIADEVTFTQLRRALAEAEYQKLVTLEEVEAALGRGKPGSARLRAALRCHRPQLARTKSVLEEKFILLCERHSLTPPDVNVEVAGYEVDAVWFEQKLVVELDSQLAHGTPARLEEDHRRDLALRAAGFTVLRYTRGQLRDAPEPVIADLRRHGIR
jgi:very-short-patch-repair endonuclease